MAEKSVRDAFNVHIGRLQAQRARLLAEAQAIQARIDELQAERAKLTQAFEDLLAYWQTLNVVKPEDSVS